jgi:hypothetical protein
MNASKPTKPAVATTLTPEIILERQRKRANRALLKRRRRKSGQ